MKRLVVACLGLALFSCGEGRNAFRASRDGFDAGVGAPRLRDAAVDAAMDATMKPGVCELSKCPVPDAGLACCTPNAQCGMDPTGLGLNCVPLPGQISTDAVCVLAECPTPTVGNACCTPFAQCGVDPFGTGQICFANPPATDAGAPQPTCDLTKCPEDDAGATVCCLADGSCGVDSLGIGVCFAPPPSSTDTNPPPVTGPPDDPSITGECPSYLGAFGPVWGCCSDYGVCGTFDTGTCLLPIGTQIPVVLPSDEDGGDGHAYPLCVPPQR